jgi:hypothetical protein
MFPQILLLGNVTPNTTAERVSVPRRLRFVCVELDNCLEKKENGEGKGGVEMMLGQIRKSPDPRKRCTQILCICP